MQRDPLATGTSGHKRLRDFSGADERDRWRSSWARFPKLCQAVVAAIDESAPAAEALNYAEEIEKFAGSWHDAGLPVPEDYAAPDAQPALKEDRAYQSIRGKGDGRRVAGVVPSSRRMATAHPSHATIGEQAAPILPQLAHLRPTDLLETRRTSPTAQHTFTPHGDGTLCQNTSLGPGKAQPGFHPVHGSPLGTTDVITLTPVCMGNTARPAHPPVCSARLLHSGTARQMAAPPTMHAPTRPSTQSA